MNYDGLLELFHNVGQLKTLKRAGWNRVGIPEPESVADHVFRTAFIAMFLGDLLKLDTEKLIKMAMVHDLPEIITGDITPYDDLTVVEKRNKEVEAIKELLKEISNGNEYIDLWLEYDEQRSTEAKILKNIDKLEMAFQAIEYKNQYPNKNLTEFFEDVEKQINIDEVRKLYEILKN